MRKRNEEIISWILLGSSICCSLFGISICIIIMEGEMATGVANTSLLAFGSALISILGFTLFIIGFYWTVIRDEKCEDAGREVHKIVIN